MQGIEWREILCKTDEGAIQSILHVSAKKEHSRAFKILSRRAFISVVVVARGMSRDFFKDTAINSTLIVEEERLGRGKGEIRVLNSLVPCDEALS